MVATLDFTSSVFGSEHALFNVVWVRVITRIESDDLGIVVLPLMTLTNDNGGASIFNINDNDVNEGEDIEYNIVMISSCFTIL